MDPASIGWLGFVAAFALAALLYVARQRRAELAGVPWVAPWCVSEGGSSGDERQHFTLAELWELRGAVRIWVLRGGVPERDAEDVVQNVIKGAWESRLTWTPESGKLSTWVFTITRNHVSVYRRRACIRREFLVSDPSDAVEPAADPERALELRQKTAAASAILGCLPDHLRLLFTRYEVEGAEMRALADELGWPQSTAWERLAQARALIAREVLRERARRR